MKWDDLRIFLYTAEAGSYAKASQFLKIDRTTVARRIEILEKHFKFKLFFVKEHQLFPTPEGANVLHYAAQVRNTISELNADVGNEHNTHKERVKLAISKGLGSMFTEQIMLFNKIHPQVELEIITSNNPAKAVAEKFCDIGLMEHYSQPEAVDAEFVCDLKANFYYGRKSDIPVEEMPVLYWHNNPPAEFIAWINSCFSTQDRYGSYVSDLDNIKKIGQKGNVIVPLWSIAGDEENELQSVSEDIQHCVPIWVIHSKLLPLTMGQRILKNHFLKHIP